MNPMTLVHAQPADTLPQVLAALHTRIVRPLIGREASFDERAAWLRGEVCRQLSEAMATAPDERWLHMVCSTCLSPMFTGWQHNATAWADQVHAHCGVRPVALLRPYECAGWGYALRFAGTHTGGGHVALSIVDADLHDVIATAYERVIGRIGFGVTTLGLHLPPQPELPRCGGPFPNHAFNEFLHAVKALHRQHGRTPTFIPFLPAGFAGVAERMIGTDMLGPNRHAFYGHTFGADPWIGLIEWLQAHPLQHRRAVTLGAFAYDGYFTAGNLAVSPATRVALAHFGPAAETMRDQLHEQAEVL